MKCYLAFAVLILTASLAGQVEHAPTVAQCQADQRLWLSQVEDNDSSLKYDALNDMAVEMGRCTKVDPPNEIRYDNVYSEATAVRLMRLKHFLVRHQLWSKFIEEDAAGKR
jgi:hypothetical protein